MNKFMFLDIDEVVSTFRNFIAYDEKGLRQTLDPIAIKLVERALKPNTHLVISSSWRYSLANWDRNFFVELFKKYDCPLLAEALNHDFPWCTGECERHRDIELKKYIQQHCVGSVVCIIDDAVLDKSYIGVDQYVHVESGYNGLSLENFIQMQNIMKKTDSNVERRND